MSLQTILLHPRPYAQSPGTLLLLPLLPTRQFNASLPNEIWAQIFENAIDLEGTSTHLLPLMFVCKRFKGIVHPLLYSHVSFTDICAFESFTKRLHEADAKWDSLRRIPYSCPARWVQSLDLNKLAFEGQKQALQLDSLLTNLFPLLPFLSDFSMSPSFILSRRALTSLSERHGVTSLRSLRGISYVPSPGPPELAREALVELLRNCTNLEELEVIGQGLDPIEHETIFLHGELSTPVSQSYVPLQLPKLRQITLLAALQSSPLMLSLLLTPLPSLTKLTITPYDDIPFPASFQSQFISTHGESLRSLLLYTPKSWPTRLHPSPANVLQISSVLRHLSLELPLPALELTEDHPLEMLSIPKPGHEAWALVSRLLPHLPSLKAVRARDVKWLRKGMGPRAMEAGVQGEMREWRRRLARRGIRILDSEWKDADAV